MKTLYLDCGMGAAGDMLTAALLELLPDPAGFVDELNHLGIPGVEYIPEKSEKCGIVGTHVTVRVNGEVEGELMHEADHVHAHEHHHIHEYEHKHGHEHDHNHEHSRNHDHEAPHDHMHAESCEGHAHHHHSGMHEIEHIVSHLSVSDSVKSDILAVYQLIAEAESHAHGVPVTEIHFHEVGTMDAVADVAAVCLLMERLGPDLVIVSPVHVGSGQVHCVHGILPVPAPATAYILRDVPIYGGKIRSELCTPTGAALLKHFASEFGSMPPLKVSAIGYGMGRKDFAQANCVRAMIGETGDAGQYGDTIAELRCNIDDMTAESISFAEEQLLSAGARDVYAVPIQMKKGRIGTLLSVMCAEAVRERMVELIFRYTTTIGVRETLCRRYILSRKEETVETGFGEIRRKTSTGYGVTRRKYEYDDIAQIAREQNLSLEEVKAQIGNKE